MMLVPSPCQPEQEAQSEQAGGKGDQLRHVAVKILL